MKVTILSHTLEPERTIAAAGKLCYSPSTISNLHEGLTEEEIKKFNNMLTELGHESPLEHVSITFGIEGVSRIVEQQLTRHRIASYSIQSGRYVDRSNAEFTIPSAIKNDEQLNALIQGHYDNSKELYEVITNGLIKKQVDRYNKRNNTSYTVTSFKEEQKRTYSRYKKIAIEDARYVFPNSLQTQIVCTMNIRTLSNFFEHRLCTRAQKEIRELANLMLDECIKLSPALFGNMGAACESKGYCPEGAMCCGIAPTLDDLIKVYKEHKESK